MDGLELTELLGTGGMAEVWRGRQLGLNRDVAVKLLLPALAADPDQRARFVREARLAARLRHPNIVEVFDVDHAAARPAIAMELVDGGSLRGRLRGGLSLRDGVALVLQILEALGAAHGQGVVHRDLKPENVLLTRAGTVKVGDWGLARSLDDTEGLTKTGVLMGTPGYAAPEQILGRTVGPRADLYSVGSILYELVEGGLPWSAGSPLQRFSAQLSEKPPRPSRGPAGLADLVERLLAREVTSRPASAQEVVERLRALFDELDGGQALASTVAPGQAPPVAPPPPLASGRARLVGAVALALSVALALAGSWPRPPAATSALDDGLGTPRLAAFDRLELRARPAASARWRWALANADAPTRPWAGGSLEAGASSTRQDGWLSWSLPLPASVTAPAVVAVWPAGSSPGDPPRTFPLDPAPLVDELLRPLEGLTTERRFALFRRLDALRRLVGRGSLAPSSAPAEVLKDFSREGLGAEALARLARDLPRALGPGASPASPLARRLEPLLQLQVLLLPEEGLPPPFGDVGALLGYEFRAKGYLPAAAPPWHALARRECCTRVNGLRRYLWLASEDYLEPARGRGGDVAFAGMAYAANAEDEDLPAVKEMGSRLDVPVAVAVPDQERWPPRAALLDLAVRGTVKTLYLVVRVNDGPPFPLYNTGSSRLDYFLASARLEPSWLREGENVVRLQVECIPLKGAWNLPLSVRYVAVRARWR